MTKQSKGFTVIELLFIVALLIAASVLFFIQKNSIEISAQDNTKKTAINAMYYSLEEVFYPTNKYYPQTISSDNLKSVDPALFTDPNGIKLGTAGSIYTYTPADCTDNKCKKYTLKSTLANEADFIKTNKNN
jgi:type II secretory pathway pseudopilin PulG